MKVTYRIGRLKMVVWNNPNQEPSILVPNVTDIEYHDICCVSMRGSSEKFGSYLTTGFLNMNVLDRREDDNVAFGCLVFDGYGERVFLMPFDYCPFCGTPITLERRE